MAGVPKPPGRRIERGSKAGGWRTLPPGEGFERAPALPQRKPPWLKSTREWWARAWESPMATVWIASDVDALLRLAYLKDEVARDVAQPSLHAQITALEDRLGLTPKARRMLSWEIAQAEPPEADEPVDVPRLRVVEDG